MIPRTPLSRRHVFALLLSSALSTTLARRLIAQPQDRGIGGTGVAPPTDESDRESDRGIGGTGVIGTIRKFGSIIVNDLRIAYAPDAVVRIDGAPATVRDLKIGQVVRVSAGGAPGRLTTHTIDVTSEVVGPVERIAKGRMIVLGQSVSTSALEHNDSKLHDVKLQDLKLNDTVAVSGLRRNDGTIVASLVERRDGAPNRIAGPVRLDQDGALRIGGLALSGADAALVGRRALVEGTLDGDRFAVTHSVSEASLLPSSVRTLSIESYVQRNGNRLALGSGFNVAGQPSSTFPANRSVRAVLTTSLGADGGLTLDHLRTDGRSFGPDRSQTRDGGHDRGAPGQGPGNGHQPMNFDGPGGHTPGGPNGGPPSPGGPGGGFGGQGGGLGGQPGAAPPPSGFGGGGGPGGGFGGGGFGGGPGGGGGGGHR